MALGYWNRPELTAKAFRETKGERQYLTGDLATTSWALLGRRDVQLKATGEEQRLSLLPLVGAWAPGGAR